VWQLAAIVYLASISVVISPPDWNYVLWVIFTLYLILPACFILPYEGYKLYEVLNWVYISWIFHNPPEIGIIGQEGHQQAQEVDYCSYSPGRSDIIDTSALGGYGQR
jgi:hypothetical protein